MSSRASSKKKAAKTTAKFQSINPSEPNSLGSTVPLAQKVNLFMSNQTPTPGSPAAILQSFQASDLTSNSNYGQALKLQQLFDVLAATYPELKVIDIVAIQSGIANGDANTTPFATLRNFGITEADFLNLYLKRANHGDTPQLANVGKAFEIIRSVGLDASGKPNKFQALLMLIEEQNVPNVRLKPQDVPALLLGFKAVRDAAEEELSKYI